MVLDLTPRLTHGLPLVEGMQDDSHETFAFLLCRHRKTQGWTQDALAQEWNYSFETISAWERGKRFPAGPELPRLACLLDIDARELAQVVLQSKPGQPKKGKRPAPEASSKPFAQGRLLWTLHLGIEHGRLQCVITCPLATGEVWKVPLDCEVDAQVIQLVHQTVHEQISQKAGGPFPGTSNGGTTGRPGGSR